MASLAMFGIRAAAGDLVSRITIHVIHSKSNQKQKSKVNEEQKQLEGTQMEVSELIAVSNREKVAAEVRFFNFHELYQVEQIKREDNLNKMKEDIKNAKTERESSMEMRHEQWEREQNKMIEAEKDHQSLVAAEAKEGLKQSHHEFERLMALDRERLAKEEEFLYNARLEHYHRLEDETERFKQSQASYKRSMEEDRERMALEMNLFVDAQKKWDNYKVVLLQNFDKIEFSLNEGYQLRRDQQALEERFKSKTEDMVDEQKNMTDFEEELELKDLTVTFLDYCNLYTGDPDKLTKEMEVFQRKLTLQLNELKNSMTLGDKSLARLGVWKDGALLDMKIFVYLSSIGGIKPEAIRKVSQKYLNDIYTLLSNFNSPNVIPYIGEELRAIENLFHDQVQQMESCIDRALPESTSLLAIQATATESSILLSSRTECTVAEGRVPAASKRGVHESEIMTKSGDESQLSTRDNWARCDAAVHSLRQSLLEDQSHVPSDVNSTKSDALVESLG